MRLLGLQASRRGLRWARTPPFARALCARRQAGPCAAGRGDMLLRFDVDQSAALNQSSRRYAFCPACFAKIRGGIHANDGSVFHGRRVRQRGGTDIPSGASIGCRGLPCGHSSNRENSVRPTARLRLSPLYMAHDLHYLTRQAVNEARPCMLSLSISCASSRRRQSLRRHALDRRHDACPATSSVRTNESHASSTPDATWTVQTSEASNPCR